tara:strand:+ start:426 stop:1019 length:594 start_codon:yes stop_codon:yes gene_type:complete
MVFYLGKDVSVYLSTENSTLGVSPATGSTSVVNTSTATFAVKLQDGGSAVTETEQSDLTAVDLSIGALDEDITYFGMRTALKAEIKKETTLTLTRKKSDPLYEYVFDKLRYGLSGTSVNDTSINDGLSEPTVEYGYRAYVHLSGTSEVMTIPNCVVSAHTVSLSADGTTEETLELTSMVTPVISGANYVTATLPANL